MVFYSADTHTEKRISPMQQESEAPAPRRRRTPYPWQQRRRRVLFYSLLPMVLIGAYLGYRLFIWAPVAQKIQAVRAAGHPVTLEEYVAWRNITEEDKRWADACESAWDTIYQALPPNSDKLPFVSNSDFWESIPLNAPPPPEALALAEQTLKEHAESMQGFHQALSQPVRIPVILPASGSHVTNSGFPLYWARMWLELEALVALENGDLDALPDILAMMIVPQCGNMENLFLLPSDYLESVDTLRRLMSRIFSRTALPDTHLDRLETALACPLNPEQVRAGLVALRCLMIDLYMHEDITHAEDARTGLSWRQQRQRLFQLWENSGQDWMLYALGTPTRELGVLLDCFDALMQAAGTDYLEGMKLSREAIIRLQEQRRVIGQLTRSPLRHGSVNMVFRTSPMLYPAHMEAVLRVLRTGLAVERYRNAHGGAPPEHLVDLVPEYLSALPLDPFNGEVLHYSRLDDSYLVYSVGSNLKDDGGDETEHKTTDHLRHSGKDIVFRVMR